MPHLDRTEAQARASLCHSARARPATRVRDQNGKQTSGPRQRGLRTLLRPTHLRPEAQTVSIHLGIPIKSPLQCPSERSLKRARTEMGGGSTAEEESDVRLSEGLRALFGNRKYVKESEITRAHLMQYLCDKGER